MSIYNDDATSLDNCEILCERLLTIAITIQYTNDCSKRLFNPLGGKHD